MNKSIGGANAPTPFISTRGFEEVVRRALFADDPNVSATMRRVSAAASILIAGRPGRGLVAPEPLVQVGFEPNEQEMDALVSRAAGFGRDLIHISCHTDEVGGPTGMIATVYFENGKARPHRRGGLLCAGGSSDVLLSGVSDVEDEPCHFILKPGRKMVRVAGYPVDDLSAGIHRAGEKWIALSKSPTLGNQDGERLWVHQRVGSEVATEAGAGRSPSFG